MSTTLGLSFATPSAFQSDRERSLLALAADRARPVRFRGRVAQHVLGFRTALQALGQLVWRDDTWRSEGDRWFSLDPIVTVHPDRVFFEALSGDQSAYGMVILPRELFQTEGPVAVGTTNVDFTAWLWAALGEMRSSRPTVLSVGGEGVEVATEGAGGRFESRVDVPDDWVRGFLQLQGAMALPGTRLRLEPIDLLAAIRYLRVTKARVSPRSLRYELQPDQDAAIVLEPWEHRIRLRGTAHGFTEPKVVRTWGRRRLNLLEPLLPFAERVEVYLKGRALPSFYVVHLPGGLRFVLGLTGWTSQRWTAHASFDLLTPPCTDPRGRRSALARLAERVTLSADELAQVEGVDGATATRWLTALCAEGRALYDVETRAFRHRELFPVPVDPERLYPPDRRREDALRFLEDRRVRIISQGVRETTKRMKLKTPDGSVTRDVVFRDWVVHGSVHDVPEVEVVLNDEGRLIFGRCGCPAFQEHLMSRGPCEHLLALLWLAQPLRRDTQSSVVVAADEARGPALGPPASAGRAAAANGADDADEGGDEFDDERGAGDDD